MSSIRNIKHLTTITAEKLIEQLPNLREKHKSGIEVLKEKLPDDLMEVITGKMALDKYRDFKSLKNKILHSFLPADNVFWLNRNLQDSINSLFPERRDEEGNVIPDYNIIKKKIRLLIFNFRHELIELIYNFNYDTPKLKLDTMRNKLYEKYKMHDDNKLYSDINLFLVVYFGQKDNYDNIKNSLLKYVPDDYNEDDYNVDADIKNKFIIDNLNMKLLKIISNYYYNNDQEASGHTRARYKNTLSIRKKKNKKKKTKKRRV